MSVSYAYNATYSFSGNPQSTQPEKTHQEYEADLAHVVKNRFGYHANQHPFRCNTYSIDTATCVNRTESGDIETVDSVQLKIHLNYPLSETGNMPTQKDIDAIGHFAPLFRDSYRGLIPLDSESFKKNSVGVRFGKVILADGSRTLYVDQIFITAPSLNDPKIVLVRSLLDTLME